MDLKIIDAMVFSVMAAAVVLSGFSSPAENRKNYEKAVFHIDLDEEGESIAYHCRGLDVRFYNSGKEDAFRR